MHKDELKRFGDSYSELWDGTGLRLMAEITALRVEVKMMLEAREMSDRLLRESYDTSRRDRADLRRMIEELKVKLNGHQANGAMPDR